jgi:biopolymer transport protein ExbB
MEEALYEMSDDIANDRIRTLVWMEVAGAAGPMLGLFGTVYGMIMAFTQMVATGGQPKAGELAGGIATALVCTFWGLVVGIPGVIAAAIYRVKIERMSANATREAQRLLSVLRPGAGKAGDDIGGVSRPTPAPSRPAPGAKPQPLPAKA